MFKRKTSGLVKSIGIWGAIAFGVHCISLSSSGLIPFSWVASVWPGASIIGLLLIAMITAVIHGYTFSFIGVAMPRSGADYVLASRVLNPVLAFVASWVLVIFSGIVIGGLIAWIPQSVIPALFKPIAIIFDSEMADSLVTYSVSSQGSMVIGFMVLLITVLLMMLPKRMVVNIMKLGMLLGIIAWIIILFVLGTADIGSFEVAWNEYMSTSSEFGSFESRIDLAENGGMLLDPNKWKMTLAGLIMGFWIFYGYYIPTFFSGEVKSNNGRTLIRASIFSILITGFIFIAAVYLLQRHVSLEWIAAEGFINNNGLIDSNGEKVLSLPWITFYAAILKPNIFLVLFVAFAWIFTLINLFQSYFFYASRIIFAWSFDRILPKKFTTVSSKSNSPIYCIFIIALLAFIGLIDASYGGPLNTQMTFAFFAVITQLVAVVAIILFPYKMKEQFELCPPFVTKRIFGVPRVSILGVITLIYLLWMIIASFLFPAVGIENPANTLTILILIIIIGLLVFYLRENYLKKKEKFRLRDIYKYRPPA